MFVAQTSTAGNAGLGTFTLGADGAWTYTADNTQSAIQALGDGATKTDTFTAVAADGTTQVVTVTITGVGARIELSEIETSSNTRGFVINGVSADDQSGYSVSSAGDVNGDGFDDLIVGAQKDDPNGNLDSGSSFVVFGKADGTAVELSAIENSRDTGGFVINGLEAGDYSGCAVSGAGDVNGDGYDDLIVGARYGNSTGTSSGSSFVVFGKTDGSAVELSAIEQNSDTGGFVINGASAYDNSGWSVSGAGDVNGDGLDDLIVGASGDDPNDNTGANAGASFVVFGKANGEAVELSAIATNSDNGGFVINGVSGYDYSGCSVSNAGDVNGDGLDDLIIGAKYDGPSSDRSGASFVVFGKATGAAVELSDIELNDNTGGFVINGVSADDYSGSSVSGAGDVNGDGFDDLIIGAKGDDPNGDDSGASFVVFGKADHAAVVELSTIELDDNTDGFVINGVSGGDNSGWSVSGAGDVNGDGFDDLIIGANGDDPNANRDSGASFVVFGGDFIGAATQVGTTGVDTLTGTSGDDIIFAGTGDDTISGSIGTDRLSGGEGSDVFVFATDDGTSTITDFRPSETTNGSTRVESDQVDVNAFSFADFAALQNVMSVSGGGDTKITLDADTFVFIDDVAPTDLVSADFIL